MGSDDHHDHGPHRSDDPRYTETWYWNLVDPETRCVVTLHCSWLPALGRGQHTMGVLTPQGTRRERVDTTSPLSSEVASVDIVEPWARARLAYVEQEPNGWRDWLLDEDDQVIQESDVQRARLSAAVH